MTLDDLDSAIVAALRENGRVSNREIGRQIGVSEATIRARIRRLEDEGIMRICAVGDTSASSGMTANAMIGLTVSSGKVDTVIEKLLAFPEVTLASTTIGRHDIIIGVTTADLEALAEFVLNGIGRIPGVDRSVTYQAVSVVKHDFAWARLLPFD
jgi:Lrp/AsnC family transcriptional regulator for asnA, asnC and gidA